MNKRYINNHCYRDISIINHVSINKAHIKRLFDGCIPNEEMLKSDCSWKAYELAKERKVVMSMFIGF